MTVYIGLSIHTANCYFVTANVCFLQNGWTPLMTASIEGHVDIVRLLIEAKAEVNTQEEVCCS